MPALNCGSHDGGRIERDIDIAGDQILHRQAGAAIRHHLPFQAERLLQQDAGDVARRADAGIAFGGLVTVFLQPGDQFLQIVCGHALAGVDHEGLRGDERDRLEVLHQVEVERIDRAVGHVRSPLAEQDSVAVGCRALGLGDADGAAGAARVLDHHRLAELLAHALRRDPRQHVGRSARCQRYDHDDRMRRIVVRICRGRRGNGCDQNGRERSRFCGKRFADHSFPPRGVSFPMPERGAIPKRKTSG